MKYLILATLFLSCNKISQEPMPEIESKAVSLQLSGGLYIDYINTTAADKRSLLGTVTRQIAGTDVLASNVKLLPSGEIQVLTQGNQRKGGVIITKQKYGYGSYLIKAKPIQQFGGTNAFWTFHYEEAYPGQTLYNEIVNEGISPYANYVVRNHEIDIETIHPNIYRFNSWQGEKAANYTAIQQTGKNIYDGKFHDFRFDWTPGKIEYYIDQVKVATITTDVPDIKGRLWIGVWFPTWAGTATHTGLKMIIRRITITPLPGINREKTETYPENIIEIK